MDGKTGLILINIDDLLWYILQLSRHSSPVLQAAIMNTIIGSVLETSFPYHTKTTQAAPTRYILMSQSRKQG
jgi:hypothetical protein